MPLAYAHNTPTMDLREGILGNCRWLFGQEVNLISFTRDNTDNLGYWQFIIVPKNCSLKSLAQRDINSQILYKYICGGRIQEAMFSLYSNICGKIGRILKTDSDGLLQINKLAIPAECNITDDDEDALSLIELAQSSAVPIAALDTTPYSNPLDPAPIAGGGGGTGDPSHQSHEEPQPNRERSYETVQNDSSGELPPRPSINPADAIAQRNAEFNEFMQAFYLTEEKRKAAIEGNTSEYAAPNSEVAFTPGTSVVSDTDTNTTTTPKPGPFDPAKPYQQMMRDEIRLAMGDLLKCLAGHIEGIGRGSTVPSGAPSSSRNTL